MQTEDLLRDRTPWMQYGGIWVKREDLSCPFPGPMFSKVRGVLPQLRKVTQALIPAPAVGVLDSRHSKAGWGVTYLARSLPNPPKVIVFYPQFKGEEPGDLRAAQLHCRDLGAELIALPGGLMSAVLWHKARKILADRYPGAYMFPNGLKLSQSIEATATELARDAFWGTLPEGAMSPEANWVVSVSSGTLAAGVCLGLIRLGYPGRVWLHLGYSRPETSVRKYLEEHGVDFRRLRAEVVDEGYAYADMVKAPVGFPCNPYYDRKAWAWVQKSLASGTLGGNVYFWNIGA